MFVPPKAPDFVHNLLTFARTHAHAHQCAARGDFLQRERFREKKRVRASLLLPCLRLEESEILFSSFVKVVASSISLFPIFVVVEAKSQHRSEEGEDTSTFPTSLLNLF